MKSIACTKLIVCGLVFCLLLGNNKLFAQTKVKELKIKPVDMKYVAKKVTNKKLKTYYPKLLQRFLSNDTNLTLNDFRLLYYGQAFSGHYDPNITADVRIEEMIKMKNYGDALRLCDSVLDKMPLHLNANLLKGLALYAVNEEDPIAFRYRRRFINLCEAILSSGNGLNCNSAFKTMFVADEYSVMAYFAIDEFKSQSLEGHCDHFELDPSAHYNAKAIYFDTSETLKQPDKDTKIR